MIACLVIAGCGSCDNKKQGDGAAEAAEAFEQRFPGVGVRAWNSRGGYEIASFRRDHRRCEAWFEKGEWRMTVAFADASILPGSVAKELAAGGFAGWEVISCLELERKGRETTYVVEVEHNKVRYDLFFNPEGVLYRNDNLTNAKREISDFLPTDIPEAVAAEIRSVHPGAEIYETVVAESGALAALTIADNGVGKTVFVDGDGRWEYSISDIDSKESLPEAVTAAIGGAFPEWEAESIQLKESEKGDCYIIVVANAKGDSRVAVVGADGKLFPNPYEKER